MPGRSFIGTLLGVAVLASLSYAGQPVDSVLLPGEKLRTVMASTGETKTVAVSGLEGGKLTLTARGTKRSAVQPSISVRAPDGRAIDLTDHVKGNGKATVVKNLLLDMTGVWRVSVDSPTGGELDFIVKAKSPLKHKWDGTLAGAADSAEFVLPSLPGSVLTLKAASRGKPKFAPRIDVVDPDGLLIHSQQATKGTTKIKGLVLDFLGEYTVRVSGGPGDFKVTAKLKPLKPSFRRVEFADVEAVPVVTSLTPSTVDNDGLREINFKGFAFSAKQVVTLHDRLGNSYRLDPFTSVSGSGAFAKFDLVGVPPGTYTVRITTPLGNHVDVEDALEVRNLIPGVAEALPSELPWAPVIYVELRGVGFDEDAAVTAFRSQTGQQIATAVYFRDGHTEMHVAFAPPPLKVGPYDIVVTDPSGGGSTLR